jgi:AraC-like DNA-binding protein
MSCPPQCETALWHDLRQQDGVPQGCAETLAEGITLSVLDLRPGTETILEQEQCPGTMRLTFCLRGAALATQSPRGKARLLHDRANGSLAYASAGPLVWTIPPGGAELVQLSVRTAHRRGTATSNALRAISTSMSINGLAVVVLFAELQEPLSRLANCPVGRALRTAYLSCRATELLLLLADKAKAHPPHGGSRRIALSAGDVDRIRQARNLLMASMEVPSDIAGLARSVGLNTFKLKQGFRQLFGLSPSALLREERLHTARRLIESGAMNVCEACVAVGYSNAGNFSRLFRRRFGLSPGNLRQIAQKAASFENGRSAFAPQQTESGENRPCQGR